jgi:hypothetical protein
MIPIEPRVPAVEGNKEVVQLLEGWLKRAQLGELNCVALVACESPTVAFTDHAGVNTSHFAAYVAMDRLKMALTDYFTSGAPKPSVSDYKHIPANLFCYDINNEPIQFDFLPWIIGAEMERVREGAPAPLKIGFIEGATNVVYDEKSTLSRNAWMDHVVVPICRMLGAEISAEAINGRRPDHYGFSRIVEAAKAGEAVPKLKVTPGADAIARRWADETGQPPIVITLREAKYWRHRNSNLDVWLRFASELRAEGEFVLFVRDTQMASEPMQHGFPTCPIASTDMDVRFALYERAKCNFFVDNGPWTLALMGTAPWLAFVNTDPMTGYIPNTPQWWKRNHGVEKGGQFPWSTPDQRIIWDADTYDALRRSWDEFKPRLARAA